MKVSYLLTSFHDDSDARNKISGLLTDFRRLVVHPPQNYTANLWQVGLDAFAQLIHYRAETVQHYHILKERNRNTIRVQQLRKTQSI